MSRPVTLFSGQWADMPFEKFCEKVKSFGYDGIEIACWGDHLDLKKAATDPKYVEEHKNILKNFGLKVLAIGTHSIGQCICDSPDPRLGSFAPANIAGKPEEIRKWAIQEMKYAAAAAKNMGVKIVTGFMGSPIWPYWYSYPQAGEQMLADAYALLIKLWTPIFDDSTRACVIGAIILGFIFVSGSSQNKIEFLFKLSVKTRYIIVDNFLYPSATRPISNSPAPFTFKKTYYF